GRPALRGRARRGYGGRSGGQRREAETDDGGRRRARTRERPMKDLLDKPQFQVIALAIFLVVFLLTVIAITMAKFYRRCGADEALVRTGAGGNKVVIGGGVTVYPILHQLLRVSLRSIKLSVGRSARNALVTRDKIRANVTTEL